MIWFFLKLSLATPPKHWFSGRHREVLVLISSKNKPFELKSQFIKKKNWSGLISAQVTGLY